MNVMACNNCHSSHGMKMGSMVNAKQTCADCHDAPFTVDKYIPGTGITVQNLSVRTHTFNKAVAANHRHGGQRRARIRQEVDTRPKTGEGQARGPPFVFGP